MDWALLSRVLDGIQNADEDAHPSIMREVSWDMLRDEFGHIEDVHDLARLAVAGKALAEAVNRQREHDGRSVSPATAAAIAQWRDAEKEATNESR